PSLDLLRVCRSYFFQAEDGIRDRNVTGVQTCALPIYFVEASAFAVSNASISCSNSAFSLGFTKLSDVISANLLSTAFLACSTASIACSASDNCSVSSTPLLSVSFTSGAVTESI